MKTKKGEKEKLRIVILEKALKYLKKHGRGGSATDPIMKHVGLTRGALYSHFEDKDDLFVQAISHDLALLEALIAHRLKTEDHGAIARMIDDHLSEKSLTDVGSSCVFTSLSSDMNRCKPSERKVFEDHMNRLYDLFEEGIAREFPGATKAQCRVKAINLYSGLVGTLSMARTMKSASLANEVLKNGRDFLKSQFTSDGSEH